MAESGGRFDLVYVDTDVPEGMTIGEWRARRATERIAIKAAASEEGRLRRARAIGRWLVAAPVAIHRPRPRSREAGG